MRKFTFMMTIAVILMIAVFIGCSDDDSSTGSDLIVGDTTSEEFQFIEENVGEEAFNSIGYSLELTFTFLDSIPGPPASPKHGNKYSYSASDSIHSGHQYTYSNGWHIFLFEANIYEDTTVVSIAGIDSIQVTKDGEVLQYPDSTMNGFKIRKWFEYAVNGGDDAEGEGQHSLDVDATQYETNGTGTIAGSTLEYLTVYVADSNATCTLSVENNITINDVALLIDDVGAEDESCPLSGSVTVASDLMLNCTGTGGNASLSIDGGWVLNAYFNGTSETYTFSDGTTQWSVTEDCGVPQAISNGMGSMVIRR